MEEEKEIEKLKNKNKDLLRKLRNRVKEVNKLIKYSAYKKEFSRLNAIIDKMAKDLLICGIDFINFGKATGDFTKDKEKLKELYAKEVEE